MTRHTPGRRAAGFTLVELLVAMAVIVVLATIAIAVVPSAIEQDRTADAAATIQQHLIIAKARATREQNGRGIRFILDGGLNDPIRASAQGADGVRYGGFYSTEMQYIEAAPTLVPNPLGLTTKDPVTNLDPPYVDLSNGLTFTLKNMPDTSEAILVMQNDLGARWFPKLICPELGRDSFGRPLRFEIYDLQKTGTPNEWNLVVGYDPPNLPPANTLLGAGTAQRSYRFAIEPRSRPILGEPNIPLPKNVCVDLNANVSVPGASDPSGRGQPIDFEVMFAPNGQVTDPQTAGSIYLWVRDYSKLDPANGLSLDMRPASTGPLNYGSQRQFQLGGDQKLVVIKAKSTGLGVAPVNWPDPAGTYPTGTDPYFLALKDANSP